MKMQKHVTKTFTIKLLDEFNIILKFWGKKKRLLKIKCIRHATLSSFQFITNLENDALFSFQFTTFCFALSLWIHYRSLLPRVCALVKLLNKPAVLQDEIHFYLWFDLTANRFSLQPRERQQLFRYDLCSVKSFGLFPNNQNNKSPHFPLT